MSISFFIRQKAKRNTRIKLAVGGLLLACSMMTAHEGAIAALPVGKLNEQVIMIPAISGDESVQLETTVFKPPGNGPFPVLIMNHGKALGDPHAQPRDRFFVISRQFVKRGYAVVVPMRKGFAQSTGTYYEKICDMEANGQIQADDIQSVLNYVSSQPWADRSRMIVAGQSYGGLATMAFGTRGYPGVRALINFAGGLKIHGGTCRWQNSLVTAFAEYGKHTMTPSLWFYGENDQHFGPALAARLHDAYVHAGGNAKLVAFGPFKNDAHGMSSSWDGLPIWWPETEAFLKSVGMPTEEVLALQDDMDIPKTDFASLDDVKAVPYLQDGGREAYKEFLTKSQPRAFAISSTGAWSWAEDGDDPAQQVLDNCKRSSDAPCKLYAINDRVVWPDTDKTAHHQPDAEQPADQQTAVADAAQDAPAEPADRPQQLAAAPKQPEGTGK